MATNPAPAKISFDEYLKLERAAQFKSEYRSGEVFAMSDGTPVHARLSVRIGGLLERQLPGCQVFSSDLKVFAQAVNEGMYPDVSVACEELQFHDGKKDVILNPALLVEVLSPSTRAYDLAFKASFYRTIPSVKALFLIDSERVYVQRQTPEITGFWTLAEFTGSDEAVWTSGDLQITVGDIYSGIIL
jgi:Uma2 family endonuclease